MHLQFLGAARTVTGSLYLLSANGHRILVECGLRQGNPKEEAENYDAFPFDIASIDAVVLSHAHLDHSGRIPLLVKRGYTGPVHTHNATRELCSILFQDAAYINEKESFWENKKRQRKGLPLREPLYTREQALQAMARFQSYPYEQSTEILPGISICFYDAGHILGSSIVEITMTEGPLQRRVVFSGDLGHAGAPILRDPVCLRQADVVLMESTYGNRLHRPWGQTWDEMRDIFLSRDIQKGNVLIPSFAIGRSQELMFGFAKYFQAWNMSRWSLFLDSPLAIKATEIYRKYAHLYDPETLDLINHNHGAALFGLPNIHYTESSEQSMALNRVVNGAVIIAGSGMCNGGRIKHHLKHNAWRHNCHILIVGFQAQGTIGRQLVDGAKHIRLWGETIQVNATVHTLGGFSAHADQQGLLRWLGGFNNSPLVMLVHGESEAMDALKLRVESALTSRVKVPEKHQILDLHALELS